MKNVLFTQRDSILYQGVMTSIPLRLKYRTMAVPTVWYSTFNIVHLFIFSLSILSHNVQHNNDIDALQHQ